VLKKPKDVLLVRFEDLKADPEAEFRTIFDYIDIDAPIKPESIHERVLAIDSTKRPRASAQGWKQCSDEYKCIIDSVNEKLSEELRVLGYGNASA